MNRKMVSCLGASALALLMGVSTAAHAVKIFDTAPADRSALMAGMDSFTYAAETLLTNAVTEAEGDSTKYYDIGGTGTLVLSAPADVGASGDDVYVVTVTLDGMVFRTALTNGSLTGNSFSLAHGGAAGDKMAVFRRTGTTELPVTTGMLHLTAQFAVSEGGGSATVSMTNQTLAGLTIDGVSGTATHSGNVIKVASALKETPMASDLMATVDSSFKKFSNDMTVGHVGSITIGVNGHRIATTSAGTDVVNGLNDILQTGQTPQGTRNVANSSVSFMGDFSFAEKVFVHGDNDCGAADPDDATQSMAPDTELASAAPDIRMMEGTGDDAVVTGTTMPVNLDPTPTDGTNDDDVASFMKYLCIMVQGDDTDDMAAPRIPDTDAYTVMGSYKALAQAANGPMGLERMLGEIDRDGTTAHIPYMTTYEGYNQRIVMSNRSGSDARYEITFRPEAGVMAAATGMATGMLMANSTMVMKSTDLVELSGGARTAATVIVEANSDHIDVTSVTVNKETRGTDTVVHESM